MSGFKNPYRGDLRSKAIEMGAEYESDWGPSCTHLVWADYLFKNYSFYPLVVFSFRCAFANTPKFNQVKGND